MKQSVRINIIFRTIALLLVISLLKPAVFEFAHLFAHHEHDICKGEKTTHLHKLDTDCDFYKYKVHHQYTFNLFEYRIFTTKKQTPEVVSQYQFLSDYQRLQTALRGPPALI
ncbi:hypothetical protein RBH94_15785 [Aestuariibaculum sp. YM273]|uniref:hypothetical protein n=1 Tax=Aestuariibaculum sp. YM273 TaxID=3070659 RepID=UPI0027DB26E4|nr:hypothetical protein [Aestuariibaculum sp. YM273]WMI65513.1 hypothetical protein RBH94_15785 [Aestuariibaculum sp. YM273]